jgi:hypothetical protein
LVHLALPVPRQLGLVEALRLLWERRLGAQRSGAPQASRSVQVWETPWEARQERRVELQAGLRAWPLEALSVVPLEDP